MEETIAAIATPFGEGALAVIRLSGPKALSIGQEVFRGRIGVGEMSPRRQYFGRIADDDNATVDEVLLTVFQHPSSYTGEDLIEITCHGGILVSRRILQLLLEHGARAANGGEFTQRAFLNGKMDLTQAEAVMDLIGAQTELALRAATEQLEGRLGRLAGEIRAALLALLAQVEASIDFPDEDIDPATGEGLAGPMEAIAGQIAALLATAARGRLLRHGIRAVICGVPNAGKSSLLNLLLGYERAIVSETPGTTRDSIEEVINLRGLPLRLVDTAGLREAADGVEKQGINRTLQQMERADLVLRVVDGSQARGPQEQTRLPDRVEVLIINKSDLPEHPDWRGVQEIRLSCLTGAGLEHFEDEIARRVLQGESDSRDWSLAINVRHEVCLQTAANATEAGRKAIAAGLAPEFIALELRAALDAVGEIAGRPDSEELLGEIFSTFCIGK